MADLFWEAKDYVRAHGRVQAVRIPNGQVTTLAALKALCDELEIPDEATLEADCDGTCAEWVLAERHIEITWES